MLARHGLGKPAAIYFTHAWTERLEGELKPGGKLHLHYDPHRMPLAPGYLFGEPHQPITAHVKFSEDGPVQAKTLWSPTGIVRHVDKDPTGYGSMLYQDFDIPLDAEEVIVWFDYRDREGQVHHDSDYGQNFRFRFVTRDMRPHQLLADNGSAHQLRLAIHPGATNVCMHYRVLDKGVPGQLQQAALLDTGLSDPEGCRVWSLPDTAIPSEAPLVFDLAYEMNGRRYVDDNSGKHFMRM